MTMRPMYSHASMTAIHPDSRSRRPPVSGPRARERASRDGGRGGTPAWHLGRRSGSPSSARPATSVRSSSACSTAIPASRSSGWSVAAATTSRSARSTRTWPRRPAGRRRPARPPTRSSWPCPTAPPPTSFRASSTAARRRIDLGPDFRLRDPADYPRWYGFEHPASGAARPAPSTGCRSSTAPSSRRSATRQVRIVGAPGLLPDGHPPRPRAARPGGAHRRPRRRRQERRLGGRPRAEGRAPLRRGQRERPGVRRSAAIATSPRSSRSWPRAGDAGRPPARTRVRPRSISCPTSCR